MPHHLAARDTDAQAIEQQLAALETWSIDALAQHWEHLTGRPAARQNKRALIKRLAYAIQASVWGAMPPETVARIATVYQQAMAETGPTVPPAGSALLREWRGVTHRVTVLPQGYAYDGHCYPSLSAVARAITGTRISGPAFFRLREGRR